jgi:hypothetical protein
MSEPLAQWDVEISATGLEVFKDAAETTRKRLDDMNAPAQKLARDMTASFGTATMALEKHRQQMQALTSVYNQASGSLLSWVRAGMAGTAEGEMLGLQFQRLHREIANLFQPAITGAVNMVTKAADWFRNLSGAQQESIAKWVAISVGAMGAVVTLPKLAAGLSLVSNALRAMTAANPFLLLAGAVAGLMVSTEEGRSAFGDLLDALKPLWDAVVEVFQPIASLLVDIARTISGLLAPAFRALGKVIEVALLPLKLLKGMFSGGEMRFSTEQGGAQLRDIRGAQEREAEFRRRQEEIDFLRNRASLEEVGRMRRQQEGRFNLGPVSIPTAGGFGTIYEARESEGQRRAMAGQMQADLDRQRREAERRFGRQELTPRGGGMESVTAIFARLQTAANRTDPAQVTRESQLAEARRTNEILQGLMPQGGGGGFVAAVGA